MSEGKKWSSPGCLDPGHVFGWLCACWRVNQIDWINGAGEDGVCLPADFQQMASSVFPVSQAPSSSAGKKHHVQIPMNSMNNGFVEP